MSEEEQAQPEEQQEAQEQPQAQQQVPDGYLSPDEVKAIVGREVAKAKRSAKRAQPKPQETTIEAEQPDMAALLAEAVATATAPLHEKIDELSAKSAESEYASAVAGLEISDQRKEELKVMFSASRELFDKAVAAERAKDAPPEPKGPGYNGLGAPNPVPNSERLSQPHTWTRDEINTMKANGTFLANVKKYSQALPGSGGGLFPAKTPGKK